MSVPSQRKYDQIHAANLDKQLREIRKAYLLAIKKVSNFKFPVSFKSGDEFYFRNYKNLNKKVNKLLEQLYKDVYGTTIAGINSEWDLAVEKNNGLANYVFGKDLDELPTQYKRKYLSNNEGARRAFRARKFNGLGLSQKIWNNTKQFKQELELAIEYALGKGSSAGTLSRQIQQYLNDPEKLFRRVKDENGVLRLSKAAKAYNPGQGRYRSSYKNAFRLARNEINFSYETSNQEKRKQQEFIVGVEIKVSPQHNPSDDKGGICCICLQGKYPKNFDWSSKWHVNCRCLSLNILKTRGELDKDTDLILAGKAPTTPSKKEVKKNPKAFNSYVKENEKKWDKWKTKPRFTVNV